MSHEFYFSREPAEIRLKTAEKELLLGLAVEVARSKGHRFGSLPPTRKIQRRQADQKKSPFRKKRV